MNNAISCSEIVEVNDCGFIIKNDTASVFISFDECAKNYAKTMSLTTSKCIATRDQTKLLFTFYTDPETNVIFKKHLLKELFAKNSANRKFHELQKMIVKHGYTTYDLS